jgi:DNA-binding LacI/PurR family transcriptional regulator
MLAVKIMYVLYEMGERIPVDVAVASIGNIVGSPFTIPPLTTLTKGTVKMAQRVADVMVKLLKNEDPFSLPIYERFAGDIVVRESCGAKLKK